MWARPPTQNHGWDFLKCVWIKIYIFKCVLFSKVHSYWQRTVIKFTFSINLKPTLERLSYACASTAHLLQIITIMCLGIFHYNTTYRLYLLTSPQKSYGLIEIGQKCAAHWNWYRRGAPRHPTSLPPISDGAAGPVPRSGFGSCINWGTH